MLFTRVDVRGRNRNRIASILGSLSLMLLTISGGVVLPSEAALAADRDVNEADGKAKQAPSRRSRHFHPAWQPAGSFSFGVHSQGIDGGTVASPLPNELRDGGDSLISQFFRLDARLYTPIELHDSAVHPRLYLRGTVDIPLAKRLISNNVDLVFNDRNSPEFMRSCPPTVDTPFGPRNTTNCNISTRNHVTPLVMWSAGLGVDLTIPVLQRQFHILTGVEYFGELMQGGGEFVLRASSGVQGTQSQSVTIVGDHQAFHGLAVPVGLHVDVYKTPAYTLQLFIEGRAAWKYTERNLTDSGGSGNVTATFSSNVRNFSAQGNGGITILWGGRQ